MKHQSSIVCGGGWRRRRVFGRRRARWFGFLSLVWFWISWAASAPFWDGWPEVFGGAEWLSAALLSVHPVLGILAVGFWLKERPCEFVVEEANPDYDVRKLY